MNRCNYDCGNCSYQDCVKDVNVNHIKACYRYNESHQEQVKSYRQNYYQSHKTQFKTNKLNYSESLKQDPAKLEHYKKLRAEQNRRYRERKKQLCQN